MKRYWFKPKQFWRWFAAYYPVTIEGWAITSATIAALVFIFIRADVESHSVSDTFFSAAPAGTIILLIFDIISFSTGEYPAWWKKHNESR